MNVGTVVDGQAEALAYPALFRRFTIDGVSLMNPIYADMQPKATVPQIIKAASSKLNLAIARGAQKLILLVDYEDRDGCCCTFAQSLTASLKKFGFPNAIAVVKNRRFENWLVADIQALQMMPARFQLTQGFINAVQPNRADNINNAEQLLNHVCSRVDYNKREDPPRILARASEVRMARNSRSFRRFLRLTGHPAYLNQSKIP